MVAVRAGVGQAAGLLEADLDPEATVACLIGAAVAVIVGVEQAAGHLEAGIRMTKTQDVWRTKSINCKATSVKVAVEEHQLRDHQYQVAGWSEISDHFLFVV